MPGQRIPDAVVELIAAYRRLLEGRLGSRLLSLRLFGSFSRGDADVDSDVDVAVVVQALTESERSDAIDLAYAAWKLDTSKPTLSPLVWSEAEFEERLRTERRIVADILTEGVLM